MWILLPLFYVLFALGVGWLGANRKFGFWGYFFCSLIFSPITGFIAVLASDKRRIEPLKEAALQELQGISSTLQNPGECGLSEEQVAMMRQRLDSVGRLIRASK